MPGAYWWGNAAKSWVIQDLLGRLPADTPCVVFDYGCGDGGYWPQILRDYPQIQWWGFEPNQRRRQQAQQQLVGLPAKIIGWCELEQIQLNADFIVSFSVLEHVYDRRQYLLMAKKQLASHGIFYLNYDDGHFRPLLDLHQPSTWLPAFKVALHNWLAPLLARCGYVAPFQQRIIQAEIDQLLSELGWHIQTSFYSNLECLKSLIKTLPDAQKDRFMEVWLDLEKTLNREFRRSGPPCYGDGSNLWRVMPSRTLILTHSPESLTPGNEPHPVTATAS
ncbi:MAG: methyltransferase domain-containing protein [Gloeomargarita sp. SKYG116]|nr:methyltransferase domain-containing protein [Gloeomargarita sp. SKYG116]MCS7225725.1 methyltransferase domain-containing protein [Gloeomargarita sp. SKYB31]MDW8401576.1 methyltransferase domain-containing protein [Gloeomargarita sp. SKYGB_i_bin116]